MFKNIYYDHFHNKIHLWENINGESLYDKRDHTIEYFVTDKTSKSKITDITGKPVIQRECKNKSEIDSLQESGETIYEGDLSEEIKFLNKTYGKIDLTPDFKAFNTCYLDIEVDADKFPKPEYAEYPINLITAKYSKGNKLITFGLKEYTGATKTEYIQCINEKELIESFILHFKKQKVDIITGWNVLNFDIQYILNRCVKLDIQKTLSPINKIIRNKKSGEYRIAGVSVLDYMELYKKFTFITRESYSLQYISNTEIGEGKLEYDGQLNDLHKEAWNKFVEYNIQDVHLVEKLEKKFKFIELAIYIAYQSLVPLEKVYSSIAVLEGYILKFLHRNNMVMSNRVEKPEQDFAGAYCYSKPGDYNNVISFDVESLYPTIIRMLNISPETLIHNPKDTTDLIKTPNPMICYKKKIGIIPQIVTVIFKERLQLKSKMNEAQKNGDKQLEHYYNSQQHIRKIMINSMYGVLANKYFHFYDMDNALMVTNTGQNIIKYLSNSINDYFKNYFYKNNKYFGAEDEKNKIQTDVVILVDTDSCYLCVDEIKRKVAPTEDFLTWSNKFVAEFLDPFFKRLLDEYVKKFGVENIINFRREKIISQFLCLAKKKYAAKVLDKEGKTYDKPKLDITGLESVRSSTPQFCQDKIRQVVDKIFETKDKNIILSFLREIKKEFKNSDIEQIAGTKGVKEYNKYAASTETYLKNGISYSKGCPQHTKAAINYNYLIAKYGIKNQPIDDGSKIKFIYVKEDNILHTNVIGFVGNYPEKFKEIFQIDYDEQFRVNFLDAVGRFFEVLGWGELNLKQDKLSSFFR